MDTRAKIRSRATLMGSGTKSVDEQELSIALMAWVKEDPSTINIDDSKNISDNKTIKLPSNIVMSKNKELQSQQQASTSTSSLETNEVFLNYFYDGDDYDRDEIIVMVDLSNSLNNEMKCQKWTRLQ
jgi:ribonuclease HII